MDYKCGNILCYDGRMVGCKMDLLNSLGSIDKERSKLIDNVSIVSLSATLSKVQSINESRFLELVKDAVNKFRFF